VNVSQFCKAFWIKALDKCNPFNIDKGFVSRLAALWIHQLLFMLTICTLYVIPIITLEEWMDKSSCVLEHEKS